MAREGRTKRPHAAGGPVQATPGDSAPAEPGGASRNPPPRVQIDAVEPEIEAGRFAVKRVLGEQLTVTARIYTDGHDAISAVLRQRPAGESHWRELPLEPLGSDRWRARFRCEQLGKHEYAVEAWIDEFATWRGGLAKKAAAGQQVSSELLEGAALIGAAAARAGSADAQWLRAQAERVGENGPEPPRVECALAPELAAAMARYPDRSQAARFARVLCVEVERERAAFGAWYELFPRSCAPEPVRHGTLRDCEARLPYIASLGFDVVYLPPIHPIGSAYRKGPDNTPKAKPGDPGSPWAIGAETGGHTAVHPELGSLADFDRLVARARELDLEIALDLAFQCSPDHPWVKKHPSWFRWRPDGTIQYAENPPKKYQDIYPLYFESENWRELWDELLSVVLFWMEHGVSIFRVDNPHTKPFAFWEWLIAEVRKRDPGVVFLSEAFTRPAVMYRLGQLGFSQSYSYFTWRNTKAELTEYLTELSTPPVRDFLRPNLFANTPDILHEYLQTGGRPAFAVRLLLAATLAGNYGIYSPPFELCVGDALPDSEDYSHSEKYEVRHWNLNRPDSLAGLIALVNRVRRENPALHHDAALRFLEIDNDELLAYARTTPDLSEVVIAVVNLDPHHAQAGWLELPLEELGVDARQSFQVDDVLGGARYLWSGARNYVSLDPHALPAHLFRIRRRVRSERDFDYYL